MYIYLYIHTYIYTHYINTMVQTYICIYIYIYIYSIIQLCRNDLEDYLTSNIFLLINLSIFESFLHFIEGQAKKII